MPVVSAAGATGCAVVAGVACGSNTHSMRTLACARRAGHAARRVADAIKIITTNRKASHEFTIHERLEAGLVLVGSEVKSLRAGGATLVDGFAEISKGQAYLHGVQINEYPWANRQNHEVSRKRKLLLHGQEIKKLDGKTRIKGYTLIPLSLYFKNGRVKVELGLVTHKKQHDKRDAKRAAESKREIDRVMKDINRRR